MTESKIEKQESVDFTLLYEKALAKINEMHHSDPVISDEIKKKFLNFHNLLPHEQLALRKDLLTIEKLPKEIRDAVNCFPYLQIIPRFCEPISSVTI